MTGFDPNFFLNQCPQHPGVYRMWDVQGELLYVGKAINLKKRLASYFRSQALPPKTAALVARIARVDTTLTRNETEALLLEQNLIKQAHPPYNILLRDDKSYPYIYLSDGPYPKLSLHRGRKKDQGRYFGPYPSSTAVRETLQLLQKTFRIRHCEDSSFHNRTRPCLQYQIKRCQAPCVGFISAERYAQDVRHSVLFLEGRSRALIETLTQQMTQHASQLDFEQAAYIRDQIVQLNHIQSPQNVDNEHGEADAVAIALEHGMACINLLQVRGGRVLGDRQFFPSFRMDEPENEIIRAFLEQYYLAPASSHTLPDELILADPHQQHPTLIAAVQLVTGKKLRIIAPERGVRARWLDLANANARHALNSRQNSRQLLEQRFQALAQALKLPSPPKRIECFDVSHHQGEATVASCVAFTPEGPLKSDYRCYVIQSVTAGDDYAALSQALQKRFAHKTAEKWPDLLLIDGGKGQLKVTQECLERLGYGQISLLAIAKGPTRKAGHETLYLDTPQHTLHWTYDAPAFHLIQHIRDEAHRFAVTGSRNRLHKTRKSSKLEHIKGIGPKRRHALLTYFGGLQGLKNASISEIGQVPGIHQQLAELIHSTLHTT